MLLLFREGHFLGRHCLVLSTYDRSLLPTPSTRLRDEHYLTRSDDLVLDQEVPEFVLVVHVSNDVAPSDQLRVNE